MSSLWKGKLTDKIMNHRPYHHLSSQAWRRPALNKCLLQLALHISRKTTYRTPQTTNSGGGVPGQKYGATTLSGDPNDSLIRASVRRFSSQRPIAMHLEFDFRKPTKMLSILLKADFGRKPWIMNSLSSRK